MSGEPAWVEAWLRATPGAELDAERRAFLRGLEESQLLDRFGDRLELTGPPERPEYVVRFRVPHRRGCLYAYRARVPYEDDPGIWTLLLQAIEGALDLPPCREGETMVWIDWRGERVEPR